MRRAALLLAVAACAIAAAPAAGAGFSFGSTRLSDRIRERVVGSSWHQGCPVALADLRYVRLSYWGFDGRRHEGEIVVNRTAVAAMRAAFSALYRSRFPIRRMRLVDDYGASDDRSIEADNTSAFNCRERTGGGGWSEHAYGLAIDVDPLENPYVYANGTTTHRRSIPYLDRSRVRRGMATPSGPLVRAFRHAGWGWGGSWTAPRDYQHFSANGR